MPLPDALQRLGVELPICQAPIGSLASAELAAAVSEAGALGHVACTWRGVDDLRALFRRVRALTSRAFGANFVLDFPIEEQLSVALDHGVPVVSFFWGDGAPYLPRVHAAGAVAIQVVGSVEEARCAADAGFDLLVAQGRDAGGHVRGEQGTMTLVPEVVDALAPLPVLAGGGIVDRRGVAAAFALGAQGVWVGTRFAASREANAHPVYQDLLVAATGADTVHSTVFDVGWPGAPMRTLRNSTVRAWEAAGRPAAPGRPHEGEPVARRGDGPALPRYHFAAPTREAAGDVEAMALYAGEGAGLVRAVEPAASIVADLAAGLPVA
ncbi:MAG: NAD(P)H-dependent flavin oxidoreductase [Gemmatimonadaceae bacterium]